MAKKNKKEELKKFEEYFSDIYDKENDYLNTPKMEDLMRSTDCDIISTTYIGSYQGDALMILRKSNEFGLLIFGYGSCSGCDALQSCNDYDDLFKLREHLYNSVIWKEYNEFMDYLNNKDWTTEFYCAGDKQKLKVIKSFIKEAKSKMLMSHLSGI